MQTKYFFEKKFLCVIFIAIICFFNIAQAQSDSIKTNKTSADTNKIVYLLFVVDGTIKSRDEVKLIDPSNIASIQILEAQKAILKYGERGKEGVAEIHMKPIQQPQFKDGLDGWKRFLEWSLKYPDEALKNNIQGSVRVEITIQANGEVVGAKALDNPGGGLAEEAVRIMRHCPNWIPAMQNGKPIPYKMVQIINFSLVGRI